MTYRFSPMSTLSDMDSDAHIYRHLSEQTGYKPIDYDTPTRGLETNNDDVLDNMAYEQVDNHPVGTRQQAQ